MRGSRPRHWPAPSRPRELYLPPPRHRSPSRKEQRSGDAEPVPGAAPSETRISRPVDFRSMFEDRIARAAARVVDAVALAMRERPFAGRTEADISRELVERMLGGGHERANFAIVGSGPNAASPHHEPGNRVVEPGDSVVCDFGGTMAGYCSDITRTFVVGEPPAELADRYDVLFRAQEEAVRTARVGVACEAVDAAARSVISAAGYGEYFIHRTGHGIGLEEHEDPYLVSGNATPLAPGHAFSVEPGIYLPGRCGARIEDIVVATEAGPERLNEAPRELAVVG